MKTKFENLLVATFGPDIGCNADWEGTTYRVAGVLAGWYLSQDGHDEQSMHLGYRSFSDVDDQFEIDRSFSPLELLFWIRDPGGLAAFRRIANSIDAGVSPLAGADPLPDDVAPVYAEFRERLAHELHAQKKNELTPWMVRIGYRAADKDMGLSRWCELTGTSIEDYVRSLEPDPDAFDQTARPEPVQLSFF